MRSSWEIEAGTLACRWADAGRYVEYSAPWMQTSSEIPSAFVPPMPDFASRSPFGGVAWFQPVSGSDFK
jgi:hypothetical protein